MTSIPKYKKRTDDTTNVHIESLSKLSLGDMPEILLLGDSLFERFKTITGGNTKVWTDFEFDKLKIFNAGIGGDMIQNVLYRLKERKLLAYLGKSITKIFLMIGTNNIEKDKPEDMLEGVKMILTMLKESFPGAVIYILGIPPRISTYKKPSNNELLIKIKNYNNLLASLPEKYIDIFSLFVDKNGNMKCDLFLDGVHFNDIGYNIYAKALKELFIN